MSSETHAFHYEIAEVARLPILQWQKHPSLSLVYYRATVFLVHLPAMVIARRAPRPKVV
jgi:hypothetical protein